MALKSADGVKDPGDIRRQNWMLTALLVARRCVCCTSEQQVSVHPIVGHQQSRGGFGVPGKRMYVFEDLGVL